MASYNRYQDTSSLNHIWFIIVLNLLVFLGIKIFAIFKGVSLITFFGLTPVDFMEMPWTIVTSMFTHEDLWHILANMLTLYFFGSFLTRLIGAKNVLAIYLLGGLLGNFLYIMFAYLHFLNSSPVATVIGASGAVFALGGTLTMLAPKLKVIAFPIPVPIPLWGAVLGGFVILSFIPGIAWQAHLGGLVVGLLAGYMLKGRTTSLLM
jgi:uncharacterized protein